MSYLDILLVDWSNMPFDIIVSIALYLSHREILNLCTRNNSFNLRVRAPSLTGDYHTKNQDSIIWKLLYQRDISKNVPSDHIASRYLNIMDEILPYTPNQRLLFGARYGYEEIIKFALQHGANIDADCNKALRLAAKKGYLNVVEVLLDEPLGLPQAALRPPSGREPRRAKTSQDEPRRAKTSRAEPSRAKSSQEEQIFMLVMMRRFVMQQCMDVPR